jgi:O-antigen/teichoic acid export membrane protein
MINTTESTTSIESRTPHQDHGGLRKTALSGTLWSVGSYGVSMALRFLFNILLSRLLVPQYFGLLTLLNTTITGLTFFSDLGLTPNIVRSTRGEDTEFLNTAWTMQVLRGIGLWVLCLLLSGPFARFYREPSLRPMFIVIGLSLLLSGFGSTSLSILTRRMAVRQLATIELVVQISQILFTLPWVLISHSAWALVAGNVFGETVRLVLSYQVLPGRNSFRWDPSAARELFGFGRWVFLSTAFTFLAAQSDRLILGRLVSLRTLGMYGIAFALSDVPRQIIQRFCGHIVFPFVSKLANLPRREYFGLVLASRRNVLLAAGLILAVVVVSADLLMAHIYDARYRDATWIAPVLALGLWHTLLYTTTSPCLLSIGKPAYNVAGYFVSSVVLFTLTPIMFSHWGMLGAVLAIAFSDLPMYLVNLYGLGRERMFPLVQDLTSTLAFLGFLAVLAAARLAFGLPFPHPVALR